MRHRTQCAKRALWQKRQFPSRRVNTGENRGVGFDYVREQPFRALSTNARNPHEYWLESRSMGEKTAKSKDCFFKNEARRLLKTKADDKMRPKTKLRCKKTGKMS
jgi:hypothetical protein